MGWYEDYGYGDEAKARGDQMDRQWARNFEKAISNTVEDAKKAGDLIPIAIMGTSIHALVLKGVNEGETEDLTRLCFMYAAALNAAAALALAVEMMQQREATEPGFADITKAFAEKWHKDPLVGLDFDPVVPDDVDG